MKLPQVVAHTNLLLATAPTITGISFLHSAAYSIAISNGHLLQIEYSGGAWKIVSV